MQSLQQFRLVSSTVHAEDFYAYNRRFTLSSLPFPTHTLTPVHLPVVLISLILSSKSPYSTWTTRSSTREIHTLVDASVVAAQIVNTTEWCATIAIGTDEDLFGLRAEGYVATLRP